jgi:hypothetical protein
MRRIKAGLGLAKIPLIPPGGVINTLAKDFEI